VPGSFICLSAADPSTDYRTAAFNHSAYATFDDNVLADGTALYATLALTRVAELAAL
jgi:hypothetical protein